MKLRVNLIPAIAYALVTMFSSMAGLKMEEANPSPKKQSVTLQARHLILEHQKNCVLVARNGQLILSNNFGNANLEWKIPYLSGTHHQN